MKPICDDCPYCIVCPRRPGAIKRKKFGGRLTTEAHNRRLALHQRGLTDGEIAAKEGVTKSAIYSWRNSNKLLANRGTPPHIRRRVI